MQGGPAGRLRRADGAAQDEMQQDPHGPRLQDPAETEPGCGGCMTNSGLKTQMWQSPSNAGGRAHRSEGISLVTTEDRQREGILTCSLVTSTILLFM